MMSVMSFDIDKRMDKHHFKDIYGGDKLSQPHSEALREALINAPDEARNHTIQRF